MSDPKETPINRQVDECLVSPVRFELTTHALKGHVPKPNQTLAQGSHPTHPEENRSKPTLPEQLPKCNVQMEQNDTHVTAVTVHAATTPKGPLFGVKGTRAFTKTAQFDTESGPLQLLELPPRPGRRPAPSILAHTPDHRDCPACIQADAELRGVNQDLARMTFPDAARYWMRLRNQAELKERSKDGTRAHLEALNHFFHGLTLAEITPGHLRAYQIARRANSMNGSPLWTRPCAADRINHELGCMGQILTQARLWHRIRPFYFPLHIEKWSPRTVLSEAEEARLWKIAAKTPAAALAYHVAIVTNNTTAAGCELRGLRLADVLLSGDVGEIDVREAKNTCRPRKISLNLTARWAVEQLYRRALQLGSSDPSHYLFPFCEKRLSYDPTRPASPWFLRKSWEALRKATGLADLRPHDLRHHCITRLLESGVEPETVRAIAGHVTVQMMDYYAHQRKAVKYAAVRKIEQGREGTEGASPAPAFPQAEITSNA